MKPRKECHGSRNRLNAASKKYEMKNASRAKSTLIIHQERNWPLSEPLDNRLATTKIIATA